MIWEFPKVRHKTVDVTVTPLYTHRKSVVTRRPWLRIIWGPTQKTIMFRARRINFTQDQSASEHLETVENARRRGATDPG